MSGPLLYLLIGALLATWRFWPDVVALRAAYRAIDPYEPTTQVRDEWNRVRQHDLLLALCGVLMLLGWPLWLVWRVLSEGSRTDT